MPAHTPVPLQTRLKRWLISGLAFITSVACTVLGIDLGPPTPMCYEAPAYTPTPQILCYEPTIPPPTPVRATHKTALPNLPKATQIACYIISPEILLTPTPEPESRDALRERMLAEGRFPADVAREL